MKMKVFIIVCLTILIACPVVAQNMLSMIPSENSGVHVVKMDKLQQAYKLDELLDEERYVDFLERFDNNKEDSWGGFVAMMLYESGQNGLSKSDMMVSFSTSNDSVSAWSYVFKLDDETKFKTFLEDRLGEEELEEINANEGIQYIMKVPYGIAWNKSFAVVYRGNVQYTYLRNKFGEDDYYLEELSERERNERDHQMDEIKEAVISDEFIKLFSLDFKDCALSDKNFMSVFNGSYDSFAYKPEVLSDFGSNNYSYNEYAYDYGFVPSSSEDDEEEEAIKPILANNHYYHFWHFGAEDVQSESYVSMNDLLLNGVKGATKGKFNKDFFKYLAGDEIMGYYSVNLNAAGTFGLLSDMGLDLMSLLPGKRSGSNYSSAIIAALINKKKAINIFSGSMLMAVTSMHEIDVRYESFSYDKETYERERIIKTKKEMRPEFVGLIDAADEDVVQAYLDYQVDEKDFIDMGSYYRVKGENNQYNPKTASVDTYVAYFDGILIITNNEEIMLKYLETGFPKDKRLSSDWQKQMSTGTFNAYWNLAKTSKAIQKEYISIPAFGETLIEMFDDMFDSFTMRGVELEGNKAMISTEYDVKQEDPISVRFNIIELVTGLSGDENPLLKYIQ